MRPAAAATAVLRRLIRNRTAVSAVEFAICAPLLMTLGLGGIELVNMQMVYSRVTAAAAEVADNASRVKQATGSSGSVIREYDINDLLAQVDLVYPGLQIFNRGRVIISSLEQNADGGQWIHWQRCKGAYTAGVSKFGTQGTGATGTGFAGMGPTGTVVTADPNSAVMFVEIYYPYQPLFFNFLGWNHSPTIYRAQAMIVRDDRDLTGGTGASNAGISNLSPTVTASTC